MNENVICWGLAWRPVVKTLPSKEQGEGSLLGGGARIPTPHGQKTKA